MNPKVSILQKETNRPVEKIKWSRNAEGSIVANSKYGYIWLTQVEGRVAFQFQPQWKSKPFFSLEEAKAYAELWVPDES